MKKHKNIVHAYCPVRQKTKQGDVCTATDTPCVYCADRDTLAGRRREKSHRRNRTRLADCCAEEY